VSRPLSGTRYGTLLAQAKANLSAQGPVAKSTDSTGEQAATSSRKLSYALVIAANAGVVAGRLVEGVNTGVDSSALLPTVKELLRKEKEGRLEVVPRISPRIQVPQREEGRYGGIQY
jgi:hypothetical protein